MSPALAKLSKRSLTILGIGTLIAIGSTAAPVEAAPPLAAEGLVQNPNHVPNPAPVTLDFSPGADPSHRIDAPYAPAVPFEQLDAHIAAPGEIEEPTDAPPPSLPEGFAQVGGMIVPEAMLNGADMVPDLARSLAAQSNEQRADIEDFCAFPDEVPAGVYAPATRKGGERPRHHTVYLNFVGATLESNGENAAENLSGIARSGHPFPPYAGGETKAIATAQAVQNDLADWAVRVVYEQRPPKILPYSMVMMGGHYSDTTAGASGGVAPLDCEDFGQRNVCYAFGSAQPAVSHANVASQEIGHTLGLGHTDAADSVMAAGYAQTQPGDLGFNDTCADIIQVSGQGAACIGVNKCHCGVGEAQHDKNTLFATFAPAGPDMVEPTIALLQPEDGQHYEEGEDVIVEFDPWDDVGGYGWKLILEDAEGNVLADKVDYDRALMFNLTKLPAGEYTVIAEIQDHADHVARATAVITIGNVEGPDDGGDDSGEGGSDDSGSDDAGVESDDAGVSDESGGDDADEAGAEGSETDDSGCGCTSTKSPHAAWWGLVVLGLALRRRRRVA